jgi:hypothetical protein
MLEKAKVFRHSFNLNALNSAGFARISITTKYTEFMAQLRTSRILPQGSNS